MTLVKETCFLNEIVCIRHKENERRKSFEDWVLEGTVLEKPRFQITILPSRLILTRLRCCCLKNVPPVVTKNSVRKSGAYGEFHYDPQDGTSRYNGYSVLQI